MDSISSDDKHKIIEWIYSLQIVDEISKLAYLHTHLKYHYISYILDHVSGFQGSSTFNVLENKENSVTYKWSHIASTYCALCILLIFRDDLSRVNKKAVINSMINYQFVCYEMI